MDADKATARERAEARRAKILARQKDRLSTITGVYSKHEGGTGGPDTGNPAPAAQATVETPATSARTTAVQAQLQPEPLQQQQHQAADQLAGQEQLQALMATLERQLQHAQAMAAAPQLSAQPLQVLQQTVAAGNRPASWGSSCDAGPEHSPVPGQSAGGAAPAGLAFAEALGLGPQQQQQQQPQPQQPQQQQAPLLLQLGPVLARSVKQTQLFRLLAAMFLAYAVLTGWQVGLPPVAVLVVMDLAVVLAAAAVLPAPKAAEGSDVLGDAKVPWRLRSLDLVSLVPGLRELLDSLAGYNAVATAVSQDFAAFVVVCGLLLTTNSVPAAVSWGLRY